MHKRPRNEWCYKPNHKRYGRDRTGSRFSPERSPRDHRMHNSEYRNYNRGESHLRNRRAEEFQPPMPAPSKNDILMQAGRLAAEYLVSVGKLPPNALSKCQNDDLKTQTGKSEGFERPKVEHERGHKDKDDRVSSRSHSRDVEPDRRRYSDEHRSTRSKRSEKWRRSESFRERRPEREREYSRSRSWATWRRSSPNRDSDITGPTVRKDGSRGRQNSSPGEITEGGRSAYPESKWESWGSIERQSAHEEYVPVKLGRNDGDFDQIDDKKEEINAYGREDNVDLLDYSKYGNTGKKLMTMDPNTDQYTGEITEGGRSDYLESKWESWGSLENESTHEEYVPVKPERNDGDFNQIDDKNEISAYGRGDSVDLLNHSKYGHNNLLTMDPNTDQYTVNAGDTISEREFPEPYVPEFVVHNFMSTGPSNQDHELSNANSSRVVKQETHNDTHDWESYKRSREGVHPIDDRCQLTLGGIFDHSIANLPPTGKEAASVDVGLSMQSNSNPLNIKREVNNDDVVYIYSEDEDDKSFSNRGRSSNEIPSVQEGFGRKISKLLGNDSPTSSSVTRDLVS